MAKFFTLIPAAGSGSRMSNALPKQYLSLDNKPMIYHSINTLYRHQLITSIFVVLAPGDCDWIKYDWSEFSSKLITFNCGGATRAESVQNGLTAAKRKDLIGTNDWILIHDAARPCLTVSQLDKLMSELTHDEVGGLLAVPVSDTLKRGNIENRAMHTEPRENLWQAQTPQMFRYELLVKALENAEKIPITDDASAIEALGFHPKLVQGDIYNFKVTYPKDLALAELIIQQRNNP